MTRALPYLSAAAIATVAREVEIVDHETGSRVKWQPNDEQLEAWEAAETGAAIVLKPRAIGISTAFDLDDVLWTMMADVDGHAIRTAVFLDTDSKAKERIRQMRDFLSQLGLRERGRPNEHRIVFPKSGAEILAISAGGERPAASLQVQRVRWSERCFYPAAAMASAGMAIGLSAREVVETTVSPDGASFNEVRAEWRGRSRHRRVFFALEQHREYRADPALIDDDAWRRMKKEGYTRRDAAAWFLTEGVRKCGGDEARAFHELPQVEPHLWRAGSGRVMRRAPMHAVVADRVLVHGINGDPWMLDIYGDEVMDDVTVPTYDEEGHIVYDERTKRLRIREHSKQVVVTVDTARGVEVTRSGVLAVDKRDDVILGAFGSASIGYADLARMAAAAKDYFGAELVVEDDGVGDATCQELDRLGVAYTRFSQATVYKDKETGRPRTNKERCIGAARVRIDGGLERGPPELAEECDELRKDERGNYKGRKDFVMMYGMALVHKETNPYDPGYRSLERAERQHFADDLAAYLADKALRRGGDGGW